MPQEMDKEGKKKEGKNGNHSPSPPPPPPLLRSLSSAERTGIMKALESVKQKSSEIERMGMSAISFSLGLINVVMTAFILGRWPEHFWVWTAITIGPMLVWTFFDKIRSNTELFMLDFCWVANILLSIFSVLCFAQLFGGMESLSAITASPFVTAAVYAASCGPLAWSVLALGNALVLHDSTATMSLFIHIIPPILMWSLRWHGDTIHLHYPNVFRGTVNKIAEQQFAVWSDDFDDNMTCSELNLFGVSNPSPALSFLLPAMVGYFLWWIPYTLWLLLLGLKHSPKTTGKDTVYRANVLKNSAISSIIVGKKKASENDIKSSTVAMKYMIMHAILCNIAFSWGYACYTSYRIHTIFCTILVVSAIYQGGVKYYKMTTKWYLKAVEKMLDDGK